MHVFLKIHKNLNQIVVGVSDEECIGKTYKQGKFCFSVSEAFFKGDLIPIDQAISILKKSANFNAVGNNIIQTLVKLELIHPEAIIEIDNTPIAIGIL